MHFGAVDKDPALVGNHGARQALDQGGLARAVVSDDGEHLAGVERQIDTGQTDDAAEEFHEAFCFEHRRRHAFTLRIHWSTDTATITSTPTART